MDDKEMMEYAVEQIRRHLPEGYEICRVRCNDSSFQFCLKNQAGAPVSWFQFSQMDSASLLKMTMMILAEIESYTKRRCPPYTISVYRFHGAAYYKWKNAETTISSRNLE